MKYTVSLNSQELRKLSWDLMHYADEFERKVKIFLERLAEVGIEVASRNGGDFSQYITYSTKWENDTTITITAASQTLITEWYAGSGSKKVRTEAIIPLLMAEFGSGYYAIPGVGGIGGKGTLNVYGHASDDDGWYWYAEQTPIGSAEPIREVNGRMKYHSKGEQPTQPLHKAVMACIEQVERIAQEVFG